MIPVRQLLSLNIKRARKRLKISQMELAGRCGLSTSFIGEIEIGRKYPSAENLQKIADSLHVRPYQLFLEDDQWEVNDRIDGVYQMQLFLRESINSTLDEAVRRFAR